MRLFFTVTKKRLAVILCLVTAIFISAFWVSSLSVSVPDGSTHAKRMEYINSLKLEVDEENVTVKQTVIPKSFDGVYKRYNELQKKGGFDLSDFKGETVTVYSFPLKNADKTLTLIVYSGRIIGGDIAETKLNGKMTEIKKV